MGKQLSQRAHEASQAVSGAAAAATEATAHAAGSVQGTVQGTADKVRGARAEDAVWGPRSDANACRVIPRTRTLLSKACLPCLSHLPHLTLQVSEAFKQGAEESRGQTAEQIKEAAERHHNEQQRQQQEQAASQQAASQHEAGTRPSGATTGTAAPPPEPRDEDMPSADLTSNTAAMVEGGAGLSA